jgi:Uma2 family endonuclease
MVAVGTRMSIEEFLALPERKPALEFDDGVVTRKVTPKGRHSTLQTWLAQEINHQVRSDKQALAFTELRATFATLSRVPDVAVYRWDRIPRDAQGRVADDFFEPPDIAIEILSPGQRINQQIRRCLSFLAAGVRLAVLIDPQDEMVLLVRPGGQIIALQRGDTLDLADAVPGLRLSVSAIFDALLL